ncbi:tRNA (cytosine-5-)-methyltransferase, putative [Phytophthora infestans T30-4]|uniref:tRNA (Cytosine-5-)-methyltransferase, putative n=2 Tax=Phytophthora infestans TaxID=4787 RepID=D0NVR0_PHYIT|nr:tRNA (cytosine-5-)-methyltransferase, putative [Phytophthora infestans T30-4]EEY66741.1 tRNA (cytosine-5-)-methyltransferase, putative [Phytophthora infestans T30-4]KAF4032352.1 Zinc knuckle [Phytophthora infestans]|eukprot:XP_002896806.1 tRNA (cytosine-5-)-methyltransferase, putative [Phytophthora infestans T30-4]
MATIISKAKPSLDVYKQSFREYLHETDAVKDETELEQLMKLLHEPLPVSFRLNLHRPDASRLKEMLATKFQFPSDKYFHGEVPVNPPKPIAWYPLEKVAWQMDCGRVALSKSAPKHEDVRAFHSCLLEQTDRGNIDRQEAVSMLPVLFLDVQRSHRVLDMCASPGSKTTQVIDFLLSTENGDNGEQSGLVIANDLDKKRAYMLVHRLSRNTLRRAVVTCGAGDTFPGLYDAKTKTLQPTNVFDRVLCDVPCSGDGTLRKNQTLWKEWHIGQGLTLHPTQLALALRGAALLRVNGIMVYSTCSFNPVENEAVVAELLRRAGGSLELLDVSNKMPGLIARPGRSKWRVGWRSKSKSTHKGHLFKEDKHEDDQSLHQWFDSYEALTQELRGSRVTRSMFPTEGVIADELHKTLRLIPTDQNSGGFFIAVLRKVGDLPGENGLQEGLSPLDELEATPPADYICKLCNKGGHFLKNCEKYLPGTEFSDSNNSSKPQTKKRRTEETTKSEGKKKEKTRETLYRPVNDEVWQQLRGFYGLEDETLKDRFWCRSDTAATVNYVDKEISDACLGGDALDIVNTGLKVFTKVTERGDVFYRPSEESLGFFDEFFTKRRLDIPMTDFSNLIKNAEQHVAFDTLSSGLQKTLEGLAIGPAVVRVQTHAQVRMNIWVGKGSILPRVSKAMRGEVEDALHRCSDN